MKKLLSLLLVCAVSLCGVPGWVRAAGLAPGLFEDLARFHGHTCAGSLMGARLGLAAKAALAAAGGEGKVKAKYFSHACPVDGVQVVAGTTYGNRALEVEERGEQRLVLTAEKNGVQVEARLVEHAEEKGKRSRELGVKARDLPAGSPARRQLELDIEEILGWFRTAPDGEIVSVQVVSTGR